MSWLIVVDHENPATFEPIQLPKDAKVLIFLGSNQKTLPVDLVQKTQPLGGRVHWVKVHQNGQNAADFVLAYELGCQLTQFPDYHKVAILSCDKGFDALTKHITAGKRICVPIENLRDLPVPEHSVPSPPKTIVEYLKAAPKNRPVTAKALANYIASHLRKPADDPEVIAEIEQLKNRHVIYVNSDKVSYPKWKAKATTATEQS